MRRIKFLPIFLALAALFCCVLLLSSCNNPCKEGHTDVIVDEAVAATCTESGLTEGSHCEACNKVITAQKVVDATGHTAGEWVTDLAASCTTKGSRHQNCTACNAIVSIEAIEATGHQYGEWSVTTAATCTSLGEESAVCAVCEHVKTKSIPLASHTPGDTVPYLAAKCGVPGYEYLECAHCDAILSLIELPPLEHNFVANTDPTCDAPGEKICTHCEKTQIEANSSGHTAGEWVTDLLPTCTSIGTKHQACTTCNVIIKVTGIAATGHCESAWEVLSKPTATTNGQIAKHCTVCDTELGRKTTSLSGGIVTLNDDQSINLNTLSLIYHEPGNSIFATLYKNEITKFASSLHAATGRVFLPSSDAGGYTGSYELLIGRANVEECDEAYGLIEGYGFAIRVTDTTIAIVGSNDLCTMMGMQYFVSTYLSGAVSSTRSIPKFIVSSNISVSKVTSSHKLVIDADLRTEKKHAYVSGSTGDSRDYVVRLAEDFASSIASAAGLSTALSTVTDASTATSAEVHFGHLERTETKSLLSKLDGNEYGITATENKIVITSHTDQGLEKAMRDFFILYSYAVAENGKGLPNGFCYTGIADESWIVDFPRPTAANVSLYNAQYNNDGALQFLYTGSGVSATAFTTYYNQLKNTSGYTLLKENTIGQNRFATFVNQSKGFSLYVAYEPFAYENDSRFKDSSTHVISQPMTDANGAAWTSSHPFYNYQPCLRIVSSPISTHATLPTSTLLNKQSYTKVTESAVTAVRLLSSAVGMCYIITLEDGRFVVIDGGNEVGDAKSVLWNTLNALHTKIYGAAPSASKPIHIAAWYVTHSHGDHWANFRAILRDYGKSGLLKMDYLLGNFPERSSMYPVGSDCTFMGTKANVDAMKNMVTGGFTYVKLRTGDKIYLANLEMEVLMTYEDHNPRRIDNSNDTNTVSRLTITHKTNSNKTTWMILGDSCVYQSRYLCASYGDYIKSDMVQLAHHGNIGCEIALYNVIAPTVVWYPHNASQYNNYISTNSKWPHNVSYHVVRNLSSVKYIYVSGTSNGYEAITLPYASNGTFNYTGIYNGMTNAAISYNTSLSIGTSASPAIKK